MSRRPLAAVDGSALDGDDDRLLDSPTAARFLGYDSDRTLRKLRGVGAGPAWIKVGTGRTCPVRYRLGDLRAFVAALSRGEQAA